MHVGKLNQLIQLHDLTSLYFIANNVPSNVKVATEEDISSYSIEDIVMPLPGYDIKYPQHVAKVWYEEALLTDGLDINNMRHKVKDYSVSGAYRYVS